MKKDREISATKVRGQFTRILMRGEMLGESVTVTKFGKAVAKIIPLNKPDQIQLSEAEQKKKVG
jgi:antitoxin (DNA-binding transcriptional repressor) of toxin-antitoxin stability system